MSDLLEKARAHADKAPAWSAPGVYLILGIAVVALQGDPGAVGGNYFEVAAQLLPVLVLALVLDQSLLVAAIPRSVEAMRGDLRRRIAQEPDPKAGQALAEGAAELDRRAALLPKTLLTGSVALTRTLAIFACAEAAALYALAWQRYSWPIAAYCALAMAAVTWQLIVSVRARAIGEGAVAQIEVLRMLEGRNDDPAEDGESSL